MWASAVKPFLSCSNNQGKTCVVCLNIYPLISRFTSQWLNEVATLLWEHPPRRRGQNAWKSGSINRLKGMNNGKKIQTTLNQRWATAVEFFRPRELIGMIRSSVWWMVYDGFDGLWRVACKASCPLFLGTRDREAKVSLKAAIWGNEQLPTNKVHILWLRGPTGWQQKHFGALKQRQVYVPGCA